MDFKYQQIIKDRSNKLFLSQTYEKIDISSEPNINPKDLFNPEILALRFFERSFVYDGHKIYPLLYLVFFLSPEDQEIFLTKIGFQNFVGTYQELYDLLWFLNNTLNVSVVPYLTKKELVNYIITANTLSLIILIRDINKRAAWKYPLSREQITFSQSILGSFDNPSLHSPHGQVLQNRSSQVDQLNSFSRLELIYYLITGYSIKELSGLKLGYFSFFNQQNLPHFGDFDLVRLGKNNDSKNMDIFKIGEIANSLPSLILPYLISTDFYIYNSQNRTVTLNYGSPYSYAYFIIKEKNKINLKLFENLDLSKSQIIDDYLNSWGMEAPKFYDKIIEFNQAKIFNSYIYLVETYPLYQKVFNRTIETAPQALFNSWINSDVNLKLINNNQRIDYLESYTDSELSFTYQVEKGTYDRKQFLDYIAKNYSQTKWTWNEIDPSFIINDNFYNPEGEIRSSLNKDFSPSAPNPSICYGNYPSFFCYQILDFFHSFNQYEDGFHFSNPDYLSEERLQYVDDIDIRNQISQIPRDLTSDEVSKLKLFLDSSNSIRKQNPLIQQLKERIDTYL